MVLLRPFAFFILFAMCMPPVWGQSMLVMGQVKDDSSKAAIPYANIGIRGKNTGTAADENGRFSLSIPPALVHDTLTFSAVGYQERAVAIASVLSTEPHTFGLRAKATALHEIVVLGRTPKVRHIGTTTHSPLLWGSVQNRVTYDIVEFAKLIPLGSRPAELVQAHIFLRNPTVDTVTFRLNFYSAVHGAPAERLVEQAVLVHAPVHNGWLNIDLTPYALQLQTDFFLGFEFLPNRKQARSSAATNHARPVLSYGAQFGGSAISRTSSLGTWKRETGASLAAYVTVRQ